MGTNVLGKGKRASVSVYFLSIYRAEIEAAKRDLFLEGGDRKGLFFTPKEDDLGRTVLKPEPEDNDSDDGYKITEPLPKPKGNRKRAKSESDSDYDPLEDSLYQDARFGK